MSIKSTGDARTIVVGADDAHDTNRTSVNNPVTSMNAAARPKKSDAVIDFQVIGTCDLPCLFCDGAEKQYRGPTTDQYTRAIDLLADAGCATVVLTGGEPGLRKDLVHLVKYPRTKDMQVYLSTNGLKLFEFYDAIKNDLHTLGLPLDGSSTDMNMRMTRGHLVYDQIDRILSYFESNPPSHRVKIGTVVSAINIDDVLNIGEFLYEKHAGCIDTWRLYQFSPLREGEKNRKMFEISEAQFTQVCDSVKARYPDKNIVPLSDANSNDAYVFINPKLNVELLTAGNYVEIGNVLDFSSDQLRKIFEKEEKTLQRSAENRKWLIQEVRT